MFEQQAERERERSAPLAARLRPQTLDEFVGQERIAGKNRLLSRALEQGALVSLILWGPPGTGKTTLAALSDADIGVIVARALQEPRRGLAHLNVDLASDAGDLLVNMANGDARAALNALEAAALAATPNQQGRRVLSRDDIAEAYQR